MLLLGLAALDQLLLDGVQVVPGRVYFVFFNVGVALVLMEAGMFISIAAYFGAFGPELDAWSRFLAITIAMFVSVVLSIAFRNRDVYIAREPTVPPAERSTVQVQCSVCTEHFEMPDVALCPFHRGPICSLCCTLEKSCKDVCKTDLPGSEQTGIPLPMAGASV